MNVEFKNKTKTAVKLRSWSEGTYTKAIVSETKRYPYIKDAGGEPPTPVRPTIPDGYWQFKTTTPYKYFIIGTDDSTSSDPYFYRLCRSFGFPYTCNVIADYMDRRMNTDVIEGFTEDDAPALFTTAPTTREFLEVCKDRDDIEFALHGISSEHLLDTRKMTDDLWSSYYSYYTGQGGTKTLAEFKDSVIEAVSDYDIAQGAPYIERSRNAIEEVIGKYVDTCGIWGGDSVAVVDGITITMNEISSNAYEWRGNDYTAVGYYLVGQFTPAYATRSDDYIRRLQRCSQGIADFVNNYNRMSVGDCIDLFGHLFDSTQIETHKQQLSVIKQYVDEGKAKVVTRKQYAQLGEYVLNPIVSLSISAKENSYAVGTVITESDFNVKATLLDSTVIDCQSDRIIDLSQVQSSEGVYPVTMYYRGFTATTNVIIAAEHEYLLENKSYSGGTISTDNFCIESTFIPVTGKTYRFTFDYSFDITTSRPDLAKTVISASSVAGTSWGTGSVTLMHGASGVVTGSVVIDITATADAIKRNSLFRATNTQASFTTWEVSNLYCWEVTE